MFTLVTMEKFGGSFSTDFLKKLNLHLCLWPWIKVLKLLDKYLLSVYNVPVIMLYSGPHIDERDR